MNDTPPTKTDQPEEPQITRLQLDDESALALEQALCVALQSLALFEGNVGPRGASFERLIGATAADVASRLVMIMRGAHEGPALDSATIRAGIRDLLRSFPVSDVDREQLLALSPGKDWRGKVAFQDGRKNILAEVNVHVRKLATIAIASKMPTARA